MAEYAGRKRTANKRRMEKVLSAMDATCRKVTDLDNKLSAFQELIKTDRTNLSNTIEEIIKLKEATDSYISQHASPCAKLTSQLSKEREHGDTLMEEKSESIRKQFQGQLRNLESMIDLDKTDRMNKTLRMYVDMMSFSAWLERALILCVEFILSYLTWVAVKINQGSRMDYFCMIAVTMIIYHFFGWTICSWSYCCFYEEHGSSNNFRFVETPVMTLFNDIGRVILLFLGFFDTPDLDNRAKLIKICMSTTVLGESIQKEEVAGAQAFRQIYCEGPILKAIQEAGLFKDSKHFVDMAMKLDPVTTLRRFYEASNSVNLDKDWLKKFVDENFLPPGYELENCFPDDFKKTLPKFEKIADPHYRTWAQHLHLMWPDLCRQIKYEVFQNPDRYSLLYVAHPFIVPGGRFREFYYWDSYWIMKGLLYSEMYSTAKGIMRNFADLIQRFGFVPNGGRVYYLLRSQPPLLTLMVYDFYLETGDIDFVCEMLPALIDEYTFWKSQRSTMFQDNTLLYQYKVDMKMPRPESYREDVEVARNLTSEEDRYQMWSNIASAAETGWDFSSRWFSHEGVLANRLASIRTQHISPVDLNAFMCLNALLLTKLLEIEGYHSRDQQIKFLSYYQDLKAMVELLHWNESAGVWFDYDLERRMHIDTYYVSNALPLFTRCYDNDTKPRRVYEYMRRVGAFDTSKGIPTSFIESAQQWDSSNVWPPMVHMLIIGFRTSNDQSLVEFARLLAEQWLRSSYNTFEVSKNMFEKYNSASDGLGGGGGEYDVQTGFGWTNGVILDLLAKYGHVASYKEPESSTPVEKTAEPQSRTLLAPAVQTATTTQSPSAPCIAPTPSTMAGAAGVTPLPSIEEPAPEKVVEPIDETETGHTEYQLPPEKEIESKMVDQEQRDFLAEQLQRKGSIMLSELLDEDDF